jgi:hypothetical protein
MLDSAIPTVSLYSNGTLTTSISGYGSAATHPADQRERAEHRDRDRAVSVSLNADRFRQTDAVNPAFPESRR